MYNSLKYWNNRPTPNEYADIKDYENKYIPVFLEGADSVLDFGCGDGRVFDLYEGLGVIGIDFSTKYMSQARKKALDLSLCYEHIIHNVHLEPLPITERIDKGLLIKVLLHAPNDEAVTIIREMGRVCEEVLIISFKGLNGVTAPHCFEHDYKQMLKDNGCKLLDYKEAQDQVIIKYKICE